MKKTKASPEVDMNKIDIVSQENHFTCRYALYYHRSVSSICYVTDEVRASLIARALEHFAGTPEHEEWDRQQRESKLKVKILKR